jgi:hypothetical protein
MLSLSTISAFEAVASSGVKFREARISGCLWRVSAEKPLFYGGELKILDLPPFTKGQLDWPRHPSYLEAPDRAASGAAPLGAKPLGSVRTKKQRLPWRGPLFM